MTSFSRACTTTADQDFLEDQPAVDLHRVHSVEHGVVSRYACPREDKSDRRRVAGNQIGRPGHGRRRARGHGFGRRTPTVGQHHVLEVVRRLAPRAPRGEFVTTSTGRCNRRTQNALCEDSGRDGRRRAVTDEPDAAAVGVNVGAALGRELVGGRGRTAGGGHASHCASARSATTVTVRPCARWIREEVGDRLMIEQSRSLWPNSMPGTATCRSHRGQTAARRRKNPELHGSSLGAARPLVVSRRASRYW